MAFEELREGQAHGHLDQSTEHVHVDPVEPAAAGLRRQGQLADPGDQVREGEGLIGARMAEPAWPRKVSRGMGSPRPVGLGMRATIAIRVGPGKPGWARRGSPIGPDDVIDSAPRTLETGGKP